MTIVRAMRRHHQDTPLRLMLAWHDTGMTTETDEVLAILSRNPMMTVGLEGSGELAFRHQVQLTDQQSQTHHHHQDTVMQRHHQDT